MAEMTAEEFANRVQDTGLIEPARMQAVWSELGTRTLETDQLVAHLLRRELLTGLQVDRLMKGERYGYFYGKYKLLYVVGKGTFARVYRASHVQTGQVHAVKVLRNQHSKDPLERERFMLEAKLVMPLRHVNIVPIYEVAEERGRPYMVMEFVEGQNLRDFAKVRGRFDVLDSLRLFADVASGLEYALSKGVTHRDLKLSNVLVTSTGRAKLVDFGLAAISAVAKGDPKTPNPRSIDYAGLERITGVKKDDARSDIFFAGCIFYQLLTGIAPLLDTKDRAQRLSVARFREIKPITTHASDLPASVVALVNRSMELDVERRFSTPAELLTEIKAVQRKLEHGDGDDLEGGPGGRKLLDREGESRSVMVVESNAEMQDVLRDLLKRRGYRVLVISDAQRALTRFEETDAPSECVIFCTTEMGRGALEAFNRFGQQERTQKIPAILFLAEEHQQFASEAATAPHRVLISMPLKVRHLRAILLKLLTKPDAASAGGQ